MRKQYHFKQTASGLLIWDVDELISLAKDLPETEMPIAEIKELRENYWYALGDGNPTCQSIFEHARLINEADPEYPIILNEDGSVMDGMHRVGKAYILGWEKISARRFSKMPAPKYVDKDPDELPY